MKHTFRNLNGLYASSNQKFLKDALWHWDTEQASYFFNASLKFIMEGIIVVVYEVELGMTVVCLSQFVVNCNRCVYTLNSGIIIFDLIKLFGAISRSR